MRLGRIPGTAPSVGRPRSQDLGLSLFAAAVCDSACAAFAAPARQHVERFDQRGKRHRRVDVALGHVHAEAFRHQRHADHDQEAERQHDHGRIGIDEIGKRRRREQHHGDRHDDSDHHDRQVRRHADRGDDAVDREHHVEHQICPITAPNEIGAAPPIEHVRAVIGIDVMMNFAGRLPDQEQPARDQDEVAP